MTSGAVLEERLRNMIDQNSKEHKAILVSLEDLKQGTSIQLGNHETRIIALEEEQKDFKRTWKLVVALIGGASTIIGLIIGNLDHIMEFFNR